MAMSVRSKLSALEKLAGKRQPPRRRGEANVVDAQKRYWFYDSQTDVATELRPEEVTAVVARIGGLSVADFRSILGIDLEKPEGPTLVPLSEQG